MKITIDLPEDLLIEVQALAAKCRITLKEFVERALSREIAFQETFSVGTLSEINRHGFPVLKKRGKRMATSADVYRLMDGE